MSWNNKVTLCVQTYIYRWNLIPFVEWAYYLILRVKIVVVGDCPLALLGVDDKGIGSSGVSGEAARAGSGDAARQLTLTDQLQADQLWNCPPANCCTTYDTSHPLNITLRFFTSPLITTESFFSEFYKP